MEVIMYDYEDQERSIDLPTLLWTILGFIIIYLVGSSFVIDLSQQKGYCLPKYIDNILALIAVFMVSAIYRSRSNNLPTPTEYLLFWGSFTWVYMANFFFFAYHYAPERLAWSVLVPTFGEASLLMVVLIFISFYLGGLLLSSSDNNDQGRDEFLGGRGAWL